jgi:N utilization substance protein B
MDIAKAKFREVIFLLLYSIDFSKEGSQELLSFVGDELKVGMRHVKEASVICEAIFLKLAEIDALIESVSSEYKIHRIPKVELNILRVAIYEILFEKTTPEKVAIAEGIRLAKKFGNQECFKFVNALLDEIYQRSIEVL